MPEPQVLNKHHYKGKPLPVDAIYVGRPSHFGNPFVIGRDGDRAEVIARYEAWLLERPALVERAKGELAGHDLVCWCAPHACHGDVLLRIANEQAGDTR